MQVRNSLYSTAHDDPRSILTCLINCYVKRLKNNVTSHILSSRYISCFKSMRFSHTDEHRESNSLRSFTISSLESGFVKGFHYINQIYCFLMWTGCQDVKNMH